MAFNPQPNLKVVYGMRLQSTSFDKKGYMAYIKGYMKAVKEHLQKTNPDRVASFEEKAKKHITKIVGGFKDYDFYTGESMNPEAMVILLNFREDGVGIRKIGPHSSVSRSLISRLHTFDQLVEIHRQITPFMLFFKDGLKEERV
ncbi:hypothetical protein HDU93_001377 [Gonapodya sp. JEL0774]|nr:hypothetical protein HDU93_001377 [Gonapodya sp. JEL0774]